MARFPTTQEIQGSASLLQEYQLALGKVAHEWNHMQENLGLLFCAIAGLDAHMGMGIWHALKSDRSQRDLLEAAISAATSSEEFVKSFPLAADDVGWILKKVYKLADGRNKTIHAPIFGYENELKPFTLYRNPNADKLRDQQDILATFEWYRGYFGAIRKFAAEILVSISLRGAWPEKPILPTVKQKGGHQDRSRQPAPE